MSAEHTSNSSASTPASVSSGPDDLQQQSQASDEPPDLYWDIAELLAVLLDRARGAGIRIFPEAGTLIGQQRNNNVILWDYDGDVGMDLADRKALVALFANDERYYLDPDYYAEHWGDKGQKDCFAFRARGPATHDDAMIDIVLYRQAPRPEATAAALGLAPGEVTYRAVLTEEYVVEYAERFYVYEADFHRKLVPRCFLGTVDWVAPDSDARLEGMYAGWRNIPAEFAPQYGKSRYLNDPVVTDAAPTVEMVPRNDSINNDSNKQDAENKSDTAPGAIVLAEDGALVRVQPGDVVKPAWCVGTEEDASFMYVLADRPFDSNPVETLRADFKSAWGRFSQGIVQSNSASGTAAAAGVVAALRVTRDDARFVRIRRLFPSAEQQRALAAAAEAVHAREEQGKKRRPLRPMATLHPPIREVASIAEGLEQYKHEPFICRNAPEFRHLPMQDAVDKCLGSKELVWGILPSGEFAEDLPLRGVLQEFQEDRLGINVVDARVKDLVELPPVFAAFDPAGVANNFHLTPIITYLNAYTELHEDPAHHGSGWMYLWAGCKVWHFIHRDHCPAMAVAGDVQPQAYGKVTVKYDRNKKGDCCCNAKRSKQAAMAAVVAGAGAADTTVEGAGAEDNNDANNDSTPDIVEETFSVQSVIARGGDFVYFPTSTLHRVWTEQKSFGIGGYVKFEELAM